MNMLLCGPYISTYPPTIILTMMGVPIVARCDKCTWDVVRFNSFFKTGMSDAGEIQEK